MACVSVLVSASVVLGAFCYDGKSRGQVLGLVLSSGCDKRAGRVCVCVCAPVCARKEVCAACVVCPGAADSREGGGRLRRARVLWGASRFAGMWEMVGDKKGSG